MVVFDVERLPVLNAFGHEQMEPDWFQPSRTISDYELIFVLRGETVFVETDEAVRIAAGDVLLLRPFRPHRSQPTPGVFEMFYVHFSPPAPPADSTPDEWRRFLARQQEQWQEDLRQGKYALLPEARLDVVGLERKMTPRAEWTEIVTILETALRERLNPGVNSNAYVALCLVQILHLLTRRVTHDALAAGNRYRPRAATRLAGTALNLARKDLGKGINIEQLAEQTGVTPQHLIRVFKEVFRATPLQIVHRLRLDLAKSMLLESDLSVREIGTAVGMPNPTHFGRFFRAQTGCTPGRFRTVAPAHRSGQGLAGSAAP